MFIFSNCNIVFHIGSSIIVAHSSNRHILILEIDAKFLDGVLKLLQTPITNSKSLDFATTCDDMDFDDNSPIEDVTLLKLCE